jgi:hypothetical protein
VGPSRNPALPKPAGQDEPGGRGHACSHSAICHAMGLGGGRNAVGMVLVAQKAYPLRQAGSNSTGHDPVA